MGLQNSRMSEKWTKEDADVDNELHLMVRLVALLFRSVTAVHVHAHVQFIPVVAADLHALRKIC